MHEFSVGERVRVVMRPDGATFVGILGWSDYPGFLALDGIGLLPSEDVLTVEAA